MLYTKKKLTLHCASLHKTHCIPYFLIQKSLYRLLLRLKLYTYDTKLTTETLIVHLRYKSNL
jgi:hypothetical protein